MSIKRAQGPYSYDDDEDYVPSKNVKYSEREEVGPMKLKKHTIDSDEEAEEDEGDSKYDVLREEDIDGQEEGTLDFEGETKITPFNMKEEMEDGHFDGDGFYHFKKDENVIKDAWVDNIDWVKVKNQAEEIKKYGSDVESEPEEDNADTPVTIKKQADDLVTTYTEMLSLLKPDETVAHALKRLGGKKKISSAQKWKLKKMGKEQDGRDDTMKDFLKLTDLANTIIITGNMDVYQETYEMINLKVERSKVLPEGNIEMDMFAEEVKSIKKDNGDESKEKVEEKADESVAKIQWNLRWENNDVAEIHGPFTNDQMMTWQETGYFHKGAYVQKVEDSGGSWYNTSRIDFELYT